MSSAAAVAADDNVYLFVPNLIGYGRIVFGLLACWYMQVDYVKTAIYYFFSAALDAVDGHAARALGQSSRFGAMLDMVTDRMTTMALMMCLCQFYPNYMFFWQLMAIIDISSHWAHWHANDLTGGASHKNVTEKTNPILRLYYTSRPFLFFMCLGNEAFYSFSYLCYFTHGPRLPVIGVGLFKVCTGVFLPIALAKATISVVHLVQASNMIVAVDVQTRQRQNQ